MAVNESANKVELVGKCGPSELSALYVEMHGGSKKDAEKAIRNTVVTLVEALRMRATVNFVGDFSLQVVERPAKKGRNPRTGETVDIPAKNVIKFKVGSKLKDAVN